jgi:hypothetical protein
MCGKIALDCGSRYHKHLDRGYCCMRCIGSPVLNYNFKKRPVFFGEPGPYFGFENEYDFPPDKYREYTDQIRAWAAERADRYHIVHDGTLKYGVEIVSQPGTFGYWMDCPDILPPEELVPNHVDQETAGCHIHISKDAFSTKHLCTFLAFINDNFRNFLPIFGRGIGQYCQNIQASVEDFAEKKAELQPRKENKYWWINMKQAATVEVRVFIGAKNDAELKGYLQLLHSVYMFTMSPEDMEWKTYYKFIVRRPEYFILADILEKRPVPEGAECAMDSKRLAQMFMEPQLKRAPQGVDPWILGMNGVPQYVDIPPIQPPRFQGGANPNQPLRYPRRLNQPRVIIDDAQAINLAQYINNGEDNF